MSDYGKKKSLRGKLSSAFKKAVLGTALIGTIVVAPAGYNYGTIHTEEIKVTEVKSVYLGYDYEAKKGKYDYKIITEKGAFENNDSTLHFKFNSADIQKQVKAGQIYKIEYYGISFLPPVGPQFSPNVLSVKLVTEAELKEREAAAKAKAEAEAAAQASQPPVAGQPAPQPESCLTGEVVTYTVVKNGYSLQITIPTEVMGKVVINTVKPVPPPVP